MTEKQRGYSCRVERDSVGPDKCGRATTWVIRFPRRVLAETVTHRVSSDVWGDWGCTFTERTTTPDISKNSASSRAIPFDRMVAAVREDPFMPQWTKNQKGMQGEALEEQAVLDRADCCWRDAMHDAIGHASYLAKIGVHKQDCNRLLEPFSWTTQVVTCTRPDNFFALRTHHAADPHFRTIARMMYLAMLDSTPQVLDYGEWHLPFTEPGGTPFRWVPPLDEHGKLSGAMAPPIQHSAARCAWVSYENHDKDGTPEAMENTYKRLLADVPVHASPVEHQLSPLAHHWEVSYPGLKSNCHGWLQARKLIPMEQVTNFKPSEQEVSQWREEVSQWYRKKGGAAN